MTSKLLPRLLIADSSPLSLLGLIGEEALDWLFVPGAQVWITDMVKFEVIRDPEPESDQRFRHREAIRSWFCRNEARIKIQATAAGAEYERAMLVWQMAGRPPNLKPRWSGRGDVSILQALSAASSVVQEGQSALVLADDRRLRAAITALDTINIDLMATQSFIDWMVTRFDIRGADTAWQAISLAAGPRTPRAPSDDPVYLRSGGSQ